MSNFQERYVPGCYRDCKWCRGRGCPCCDEEADKDYKKAFPDGPKPIATYDTSNLAEMETLKRVFGVDSLNKAFGDGGGGLAEILGKLKSNEQV